MKNKSIHIVHYDWFEFSTVENKKYPEKEYSMREIIAHERAIEREEARIEKGKRDAEKFVNTSRSCFLPKKRGPERITA